MTRRPATPAKGKVVKPVKAWSFQYDGEGSGGPYLVWFAEATRYRCWKSMSDCCGNRPTTGKPVRVLIVPIDGYKVVPRGNAAKGGRKK